MDAHGSLNAKARTFHQLKSVEVFKTPGIKLWFPSGWPASIWICFAPAPFAERKSGIKYSTSYKKDQLIVDVNQELL